MKKPILRAALPAALVLCATGATAAPFELTFTSSVFWAAKSLEGTVAVDDAFLLKVIVDNGINSAFSQSWSTSDIVSATATAGSYTATFFDSFLGSGFTTSTEGTLTSVNFSGTTFLPTTSTDNLGSGNPALSQSFLYTSTEAYIDFDPYLKNLSAWSGPVAMSAAAPIPLPASLSLMLGGLAALGGLAVARRRAA